jgi:hypothetical protein
MEILWPRIWHCVGLGQTPASLATFTAITQPPCACRPQLVRSGSKGAAIAFGLTRYENWKKRPDHRGSFRSCLGWR